MKLQSNDPILAIATAAGVGGIGIIRLSFPMQLDESVIQALFDGQLNPKPRHAHLFAFKDAKGQKLDDVIVLYFKGPNSYTGESVIELQAHGGPVLMQLIQKACLEKCAHLGFRIAEPGEFTKRAYLNDRIDLVQAEAVIDVINAMSESAVQAAQRSLSGVFSERIHELDEQLKNLRAYIEATLDFPEDEVDNLDRGRVFERLQFMHDEVEKIFKESRSGKILREGVNVAIVGSPNVGKSSLLNALAGEEVAIVTDIAGTTRDKIEHWISLEGIPLRIVDTAGIRQTTDIVEQKGIERALNEVKKSEIVLYLTDATGQVEDAESTLNEVLKYTKPNVSVVKIANKMDACSNQAVHQNEGYIGISALNGEGLETLRAKLLELIGVQSSADGLFMARQRHISALQECLEHLDAALLFGQDVVTLDLLAEELRLANEPLREILGEFVADDLLGMIFSRFCIGK